jgi:DNA ligase (NAD+)
MTYEELKQLILKHNNLYYDKSAPEVSDAEWDQLYDKLERMEKAQGWAAYDSPTNKVGGAAGKVTHPFKLYSLKKVYDATEIDSFYDVKTPKIDGTNLTLVYKRGRLRLALTRGDGEKGDNVLHLVKTITNIPNTINNNYDMVVINGECVTDNEVENYRNYVSGALGLKSEEEFKDRNIKFIAHDWLGVELNYTKRMEIVKNMGFFTVLQDRAWEYPKDGVVFRINNYDKCKELGYTSKYPRFAVALKERESATAVTTLQEVVWVIGRTGTVNPTGIIEPVVLDDATISRVTLHNIGIIEEHNLGLGDVIEIERAGGVIPKFLRVIEHSNHNIKITKEHAEKAVGVATRRDGPKLLVADKNNSNNIKAIEHFIKTMNIKGLGPASVEKLGLMHVSDIYTNQKWSILGANGVKVQEEIARSKNQPYATVLAALGIPGVGKSAATLLVKYLPSFNKLRDIEITPIKGIGPSTIKSILVWLDENEDWVSNLPLNLEQAQTVVTLLDDRRKVCITGKLDMTRGELSDILQDKGFEVTSTVTKDCYALISAGDASSSKYTKAVKLGVKIIDYWSSKKEVLSGYF